MSLADSPGLALVRRELLASLRSIRAFLALQLFVLGSVLVVVAEWPLTNAGLQAGGGSYSELSRVILGMMTGALTIGGTLLLPGLAALSFTIEREHNTLDQLRLTLIRPRRVALAKLINILGLYLLLCISVLPAFGAVFFLVGVDWVLVTIAFALALANAVVCAAIGLSTGAHCRRTRTAIPLAYVFTLLFYISTAFFAQPFISVSVANSTTMWLPGVAGAVWALMVTAFLIESAADTINRPDELTAVTEKEMIDDAEVLEARRTRFPFYLIDPLRRDPTIADGRNPMLVKELRSSVMTRATAIIRLAYLGSGFLVLVGMMITWEPWVYGRERLTGPVYSFILFLNVLAFLFAASPRGNALAREFETSSIDLLRMTLLTPGQILFAELLTGAVTVAPFVLGGLVAGLPVLYMVHESRLAMAVLFMGNVTLLVNVWLCLCTSLCASTFAKESRSGLLLSYVACGLLITGALPLAAIWAAYLFKSDLPLWPALGDLKYFFSPMWAYASLAKPWASGSFSVSLWLTSLACYTLLGVLLLFVSAHRLRHRIMRDR